MLGTETERIPAGLPRLAAVCCVLFSAPLRVPPRGMPAHGHARGDPSSASSPTGVIAVVIFLIFSVVGVMTRFLYQHKQSHRTSQMEEKDYAENVGSSFRNDIDLQNTVSECKREYFI